MRSLQGGFSAEVHQLVDLLTGLRVHVEAAIDFPDEEVEILSSPEVSARMAEVDQRLARIRRAAGQGRLLRDGLNVVIAGRPNAGKSSLLNALAGYDAAIVTPIPGTTRDVLRERIHVDGLPVHIVDTAGLRDTEDLVEGEGVRRARGEIERAGLVLYVIDASDPPAPEALVRELTELPAGVPVIQLWNKADLLEGVKEGSDPPLSPSWLEAKSRLAPKGDRGGSDPSSLYVSAISGQGLDALREGIKAQAGYEAAGAGTWSARARHLDALERVAQRVERARAQLGQLNAYELLAEDLRQAQQALGEITGEVSSDELLGEIFSSFCIGK